MINYTILNLEQVLFIHDRIIDYAGGKHGVRDFALLHSALERCKATFAGQDLYPTLLHKASALLHSLVMNHAFLDGNKRTAFAIMLRFLEANGASLKVTQPEVIELCLAVDNQNWQPQDILKWLNQHAK